MLQLAESDNELTAVVVNVRGDTGIADVWLNKNIEEGTDDEGNVRYSAEQAYMQYGYFEGLEAELADNFDVYFEIASEWVPSNGVTDKQRIAALETEVAALKTENAELTDALIEMSEVVYG